MSPLVADASVLRNFGVLRWGQHLVALAGGSLFVAHGVMGLDESEVGEIEGIRAALERTAKNEPHSGTGSQAVVATIGLDELIALRSTELKVATLTDEERLLAVRLQSRDPADRTWRRQDLGLRARRLHLGEAVSIAVAVARDLPFACDEADGRRAYQVLASRAPLETLDLVKAAVEQSFIGLEEGRAGYRELLESELHRFGGPPWVE